MDNVDFNLLSEDDKTSAKNQMGVHLPTLRKALNFTQKDLADQIGVTRQTLAGYESGKSKLSWTATVALLTVFIFSDKTLVLLFPLGILNESIFKALPGLKIYLSQKQV